MLLCESSRIRRSMDSQSSKPSDDGAIAVSQFFLHVSVEVGCYQILTTSKTWSTSPLAFPFALAETAAYTHSNALNRLGWHISNVDNSIEAFYELHGVKGAVNLTGFSAGTTFRAAQITMSQ